MQINPLVIIGIIGAIVVAFVVFTLGRRNSADANRNAHQRKSSGPDNLHYICAGCAAQFTHSRRTINAWEKGTRRFFCDACHKQWRNRRPPPEQQLPVKLPVANGRSRASATGALARSSAELPSDPGPTPAKSGCFTVMVLAVSLPTVMWAVAYFS